MFYKMHLHGKIYNSTGDRPVDCFYSWPLGVDEDYIENIIEKFAKAFHLISIKTTP